jgi:DNA-binding MarR family transcriptional regulator
LEAFGPLSQATLSRNTNIDRSDMVAALTHLESEQSIGRSVDPTSRRQNIVELTPSGRARLASLTTALERAQDTVFASLSPTEIAQLILLLTRVRDAQTTRA